MQLCLTTAVAVACVPAPMDWYEGDGPTTTASTSPAPCRWEGPTCASVPVEAEWGLPSPPVRWAVLPLLALALLVPRLRAPVGTVVSPVRTVRTCRRSEADEEAGARTAVLPAGSLGS